MKRIIAAVLLLALLCGCAGGQGGASTSEPTPPPETAPTPTPTPEAAPETTPTVVIEVQTDYSRYSPYEKETAQPLYTRLSEDRIDGLEPRDDYGALYPFVGSLLYESSYVSGEKYGLFDSRGRVVCDAVYSDVSLLSYWDYDGVGVQKTDYPMLGLTRITDGREWVTLATPDGSFVSPESYTYVRAFDFGVVCSADWQSGSFVIYDYEGNVLLTEADFPMGVTAVDIENAAEDMMLVYTGEAFFYMDLAVNPLHGPYYMGQNYYGEYAIVRLGSADGEVWGLVDRAGKYVIPAEYARITKGHGNHFICEKYAGNSLVIDAETGTALLEVPFGYEFQAHSLGYRTWRFGANWTAEDEHYYDMALSETVFPEGDGWSGVGETPLLSRLTEAGLELCNMLSGEIALFEGMESAMPVYQNFMSGLPSSLEYVQLISGFVEGQGFRYQLVSWDLQRTYEMSMYDIHNCAAADEVTGEEYIKLSGKLYDADMQPLSDTVSRIWKGLIISYDSIWCTARDFDGNVIFRHPLMMSDGD